MAATIALGCVVASPDSAFAVTWLLNHDYKLQNQNSGRCLDDSTFSDGTDNLRAYACSGGSQDGMWQGWNVTQMD